MKHWTKKLEALDAGRDAVQWARNYETFADAWEACKRPDLLLWIAAMKCGKRGSKAHRAVVLAAARCAKSALSRAPKRKAMTRSVRLTERFGLGDDVTDTDLKAAAERAIYGSRYRSEADRMARASAYYAAFCAYESPVYAIHAATYAEDGTVKTRRRLCRIVRRCVKRPRL